MQPRDLSQFLSSWDDFLIHVDRLGRWKLRSLGGVFLEDLQPLLSDVIRDVRSPEIKDDFRLAVTQTIEDAEDREMLRYLTRELIFFSHLVTSLRLEEGQANPEGDQALGAAKTVKESIEKWLNKRLSKRWKNFLTILNELLSLIKGG